MPMRDEKKVRMPAVAGQFYDGDPLRLRRQLMETEAAFPVPAATVEPFPVAVILPHAGYMFSLKTAFKTLRAAARGKPSGRTLHVPRARRGKTRGRGCIRPAHRACRVPCVPAAGGRTYGLRPSVP